MAHRNTALAAAAILALALYQLAGLIRPTEVGTPWQVAVLAGLALGFVLTWAGLVYRLPLLLVLAVNVVALGYVAFRIGAPGAMSGLIPDSVAVDALRTELTQATTIIRNGIEPVIPVPGLVVVLTAVMWSAGALAGFGLARNHPWLAVAPGLVLAAQFTTMARTPTDPRLVAAYVTVLALAVLAVTADQRRSTPGRMAHLGGDIAVRRGVAPAVIGALVVTVAGSMLAVGGVARAVPAEGVMAWRATTGLSDSLFGGVSYNPFISIRSSLVSESETPVFLARVSGDLPATDVSFRLLSMEEYNAGQFAAGGARAEDPGDGPWENPGQQFAGRTAQVTSTVVIDRLRMEWIPAPYAPTAIRGDGSLDAALRIRESDAALLLEGAVSYSGMEYTVESTVPDPDLDALARNADGALSPLFAAAAGAGADLDPAPRQLDQRAEPPEAGRYLELPVGLDPGIVALARAQTTDLVTEFERGLALEAWLRSDEFRYTTAIPPGHGAQDLAEWLLPRYSDQPFYRSGYCENFATAMAVMARSLGIHSRVVLGFTPGEPVEGDPNVVVVRDRNAHAWVELWIPSQGWVPFDPTPRRDGIAPATGDRIAETAGFDPLSFQDGLGETDGPTTPTVPPEFQEFGDEREPANTPAASGERQPWTMPDWMRRLPLVLAVAAVVFGVIPLLKYRQRRRRIRRLREGDVTAAWENIVARLTDLGRPPEPGLTPTELADSVARELQPLATVYGRAVYGPEGTVPASHIATAEQSMERTEASLTAPLTRRQRIAAWYRPTSLLSPRLQRHRR